MKVSSAYSVCGAVLMLAMISFAGGQAPPNPDQMLARFGISSDNNSLLQALRDPRPAVRSLAAGVLADRKVVKAVPEMEETILREHDAQVIFTLAQSLNILGSRMETDRLETYCSSRKEPNDLRIRAAIDLAATHDYRCLPAIAEYLRSKDGALKQAASLYMIHVPSPPQNPPIDFGSKLLAIATSDSDPYLRDLAGKVIMQIGDEITKSSYRREFSHK